MKRTVEPLISERDRKLLDAAVEIEQIDAASAGAVGFTASVWARFSLPYRDPGEVSSWSRRNGGEVLSIRPATLIGPDGLRDAFPFGVFPRLVMVYLSTEAVRTQNPTVHVGRSLNEFISTLGLQKAGSTSRRIKEQISRLFGASVSLQRVEMADKGGHRVLSAHFTVTEDSLLWVPPTDEDADVDDPDNVPEVTTEARLIWPDEVVLTGRFYRELVANAVPVDLRALRALSPWPMAMDIYVWLTYRMASLGRPGNKPVTTVTWKQLAEQFGGQFGRERAFRSAFTENLERRVAIIYPAARFQITDTGVRLFASPTHVPQVTRQPETVAEARPAKKALPKRTSQRGRCEVHPEWPANTCGPCRSERLAGERG
jgi:Plasmid encoded RepA protein